MDRVKSEEDEISKMLGIPEINPKPSPSKY